MNAIDGMQILILSYTLGSIPFGVLLAKLFRLPDPRYIGSGNIGATNMLRTGRKGVAALTLLCDMGKGALAVWVCGQLYEVTNAGLAFAVLMAAVGHMYSAWLSLKGGKGVATILGATLALSWPVGITAVIVWMLVCFTTRYVSVASILALAAIPLVAWLRIDGVTAFTLAISCGIGIWRHHSNISRLRRGFEPRLKFGKGGAA
jgi:glycerol-3-phosphate acyltransferase PlsY